MNTWENMTNEELCLEYQQTKSDELFEYFINRNKNLIYKSIAPIIKYYPEQTREIKQQARIALWKTMIEYDSTRSKRFSTLFILWLRTRITYNYREFKNIKRMVKALPKDQSHSYSLSKIINYNRHNEAITLCDIIIDEKLNTLELLENKAEWNTILSNLYKLRPKEEYIIKLSLGLIDGKTYSLKAISTKLNISYEVIRHTYLDGAKRLRKYCILE